MTPNDFGKLIKNTLHGVFLFYGEEQYLKQHYTNLVKKNISPDGANTVLFSGESCDLQSLCSQVADTAFMPSMDMSKRLIILFDIDWKKTEEEDFLYFEEVAAELKDQQDCVVIIDTRPENFDAGSEKKPSKLLSRLSKSLTAVNFSKESPAKLAVWVQKHFAAFKVTADMAVCNTVVKHCGRDMTTLNNEITKLACYVLYNGRNTVTEQDVYTVSGSVNEIDTFDFSNAILNNESERAFEILSDMKLRREAPELILSVMTKVYMDLYTVKLLLEDGLLKGDIAQRLKMHDYKAGLYTARAKALSRNGLEKAISLCHEADLKIKSADLDSYAILDVLMIKLSMTCRLR